MPKSRVRKRTVYTPPPAKSKKRKVSPPWVGPSIVVCLVIGLAWIVVYYLTSGSVAWHVSPGFVEPGRGLRVHHRGRDPGHHLEVTGPPR